MSSYPTDQEPEAIPGSFPETPGEQDMMTSSGRNKLHKPEDPRGWSEEEKLAHGHQYTDSGIGLADTSRTPYSSTRDSTAAGGIYDSNNTATTHNREAVPSTTADSTSGTNDYRGVDSKPGVMTGAYSRLDNSSSGNNLSDSTTRDPAYQHHTNATGAGAVGPATGVATAASSSNTAENDSSDSGRNIVRSGLRQSTDVDHQDPYWGDVPRGTGVYNTVTGHGSSETPADGSVHARDSRLDGNGEHRAFPLSTTSNTAVRDETSPHNSSRFREGVVESGAVAGVGIAASEVAEKHHDRKHEKDAKEPDTQKHETAEPKKESKLASLFHLGHKDDGAKQEKKLEKQEAKEEKRHEKQEIKEEKKLEKQEAKEEKRHEKQEAKEEKKLAEKTPAKDDKPLTDRDAGAALAAATMAYGAKDQADKHDKKHRESEVAPRDNNVNTLYQHPSEKVADRPAQGTSAQHQQTNDPFIAAGYTGLVGQHPAQSADNSYPTSGDVTTRGHPSAAQATEKSSQHDHSKAGYGLAAAGAGAGAGYAAHKHANRDEDSYREPVTGSSYNDSTTTSRTVPQQSNAGYTIGQPQLGVVSQHTRPSENQSVPPTSTNIGTGAYPSQTGNIHHDKYNTLADGTPSGIDIGNHYGDKKNVVPTSSNTAPSTATRDDHSAAKATAAGAGVAGAGAAAYYASHRDSDKPTTTDTRTPVGARSQDAFDPYTQNASTRGATTSASAGQYKELPTGTPSGVAADNTRHERAVDSSTLPTTTSRDTTRNDTNTHRGTEAAGAAGALGAAAAAAKHHRDSEQPRDVAASDFAAAGKSAAAPRTADTTTATSAPRASTDSSHGGQYNVLSSGTPSGINIGDHHGDAKNTVAAVPSTTAAHPSTTNTARELKNDEVPKTERSNVVKPAAAAAAATAPSLTRGDKVLHKCTNCGTDNDITGYFQDKKH
ncbi:hypothetical protein GGR53DRAFT_469234 [Hypoxylon sp. FL1150]|nr:hypothetical protein GGR53DRAFT_469234 [Hypoxylon sp. FL1150]